MSKGLKNIPELRFPEFQNEGKWTVKTLDEFNDLESGDGNWILSEDITSNGEFKIVQLSSIGFGIFKQKTLKTISNETFLKLNGTPIQKGDLLFNRMVDSNKINCCIFPYEGKYVTSVDVCWIRSNPYFDNYFLLSLMCEGSSQNKLLSLSSGAGRVRISKKNLFEKFAFLLPSNPKEQQKIASCLSSLDKVIAAHSQKLDLLKDHKKALMQNLFPQEGKKVPKYRFKEFEKDGEWVEKKLGDLIEIKGRIGYRGYTLEDIVGKGEGAISMSPSNINEFGTLSFTKSTYITWAKYEESPEIMLENGFTVLVKTGSTYGKVAFIKNLTEKTTINPQLVVLKPKKVNNYFLYLLVANESIQKQISATVVGGAIPTLSQESISNFEILVPKIKEQEKIAECLSSLNDLIISQTERIEQLKLHKKGLMQGLFPKIKS